VTSLSLRLLSLHLPLSRRRHCARIHRTAGHFVFDQNRSVETTQRMELGFTSDRLRGYRIRPVVIYGIPELHRGPYRPEFVDPATEGHTILDRIWNAQDRLPKR
jgi:hypothetical protein